jgi:hypothetical protein
MRTVPMFASPVVYTPFIMYFSQLRLAHDDIREAGVHVRTLVAAVQVGMLALVLSMQAVLRFVVGVVKRDYLSFALRRSSALAAQLRRKYFGICQFSSRDLAVQHGRHHPCWKAAHFLPCTRPPDVLRLHRPQRGRPHYGPSERRAFVVTRSGFQTMPSGGLGDDEATAAGASFGTVRHPSPLVKSARSGQKAHLFFSARLYLRS